MAIDMDFNATSTHLPFERDKLSKNFVMCDTPWKQLIASKDCAYLVKGLPISSLKSKWAI